MNPLTEARAYVSDILTASGLTVYPYPQDAPSLPAAWVTPDTEWATPLTLKATRVHLVVTFAAGAASRTRDAIDNLEERAWAAIRDLGAKGVRVATVDSPVTATHNTLTVHQVPIHVEVLIEDEGV